MDTTRRGQLRPTSGTGATRLCQRQEKPSRLSSASRQTETCWHRWQLLTAHISVRLCRRSLLDYSQRAHTPVPSRGGGSAFAAHVFESGILRGDRLEPSLVITDDDCSSLVLWPSFCKLPPDGRPPSGCNHDGHPYSGPAQWGGPFKSACQCERKHWLVGPRTWTVDLLGRASIRALRASSSSLSLGVWKVSANGVTLDSRIAVERTT